MPHWCHRADQSVLFIINHNYYKYDSERYDMGSVSGDNAICTPGVPPPEKEYMRDLTSCLEMARCPWVVDPWYNWAVDDVTVRVIKLSI